MTDRQIILEILIKAGIKIFVNHPYDIEIENGAVGENISFEFSESGKLLSIMS